MKHEPVIVGLTGLATVVVAGLTLANSLGWVALGPEGIAAVGAFITTVTGAVAAVLRSRVVPVDTFHHAVEDALYTPVPADAVVPFDVDGEGPR